MKRILYLFLMCLCFVCKANSQIYSYRYSHSVNEDGVKKIHPWYGGIVYITFIKDKTICYWSNAKGEISQYTNSYKYVGKENDMHVYQDTGSNFLLVPNKQRLRMFTTDFMQLGYWVNLGDNDGPWFYVFKYEPNPNQKEAPKNLF